jgi:tetratricopeptide (TPR) repeat protein
MDAIRRIILTLCIASLVMLSSAYAQDQVETLAYERAMKLMQGENYPEAVQAFEEIVKHDPDNTQAWASLGMANHQLGNYRRALEAFKQAQQLGYYSHIIHYNIACSYALSGDHFEALAHLDSAVTAGYTNFEHIQADQDLKPIRSYKRYAEIIETVRRLSSPCEYIPECRQLDFWLGHWEVYNKSKQVVGTNLIYKDLNGCMLVENWESNLGSKGKSINYYDFEHGLWRQNWVSERGYIIDYQGEFIDGAMRFNGRYADKDGNITLSRMTLTPESEDRVHQLIEQSTDDGQTWSVWFEGLYIRADNPEK